MGVKNVGGQQLSEGLTNFVKVGWGFTIVVVINLGSRNVGVPKVLVVKVTNTVVENAQ